MISLRLSKNPWLLLPRILLFLDTLDLVMRLAQKSGGSVFWFLRTILGFVVETASVSLRTLAMFFPLVTDTFSSFDA